MNSRSLEVQQQLEAAEREALTQLAVADRLRLQTKTSRGLAAFSEAFYFCRVGFVRANFILGARCPEDARYWVGLARNLWEEAGGGVTPPHNDLYRRFLKSVRPDDAPLVAPAFARHFDDQWIALARNAPVEHALLAFAAYEALDAPDYQMLYEALRHNVSDEAALEFFCVHTEARHVELFDDVLGLIPDHRAFNDALGRMSAWVVGTQTEMWRGLLDYLEQRAEVPPRNARQAERHQGAVSFQV